MLAALTATEWNKEQSGGEAALVAHDAVPENGEVQPAAVVQQTSSVAMTVCWPDDSDNT
jgi:hypothetical protein